MQKYSFYLALTSNSYSRNQSPNSQIFPPTSVALLNVTYKISKQILSSPFYHHHHHHSLRNNNAHTRFPHFLLLVQLGLFSQNALYPCAGERKVGQQDPEKRVCPIFYKMYIHSFCSQGIHTIFTPSSNTLTG